VIAYLGARNRFASLLAPPPPPKPKIQFRLVELYVLLLQCALSACFASDPFAERYQNAAGLLILWALQALWWFWAVRALSWHGVSDPLRRLAVLGIVCPLVYSWPLFSTGVSLIPLFGM